jgi:hypothetical protein
MSGSSAQIEDGATRFPYSPLATLRCGGPTPFVSAIHPSTIV